MDKKRMNWRTLAIIFACLAVTVVCVTCDETNGDDGGDGTQVAMPEANPAAGAVKQDTVITLTSATGGASIRYTTDGKTPTATTGTLYSSTAKPKITSATTLKAIAYKKGMTDSDMLTAEYTISSGGSVGRRFFTPPQWIQGTWWSAPKEYASTATGMYKFTGDDIIESSTGRSWKQWHLGADITLYEGITENFYEVIISIPSGLPGIIYPSLHVSFTKIDDTTMEYCIFRNNDKACGPLYKY